MNKLIKTSISSLVLAFALAGCENAEDKARKPEAADRAVKDSITLAEMGPTNGNSAAYEHRLRTVLMKTETYALDVLRRHNVSIVLDQRMAQQVNGTFDRPVYAIYYNGQNGGILALWDDGRPPEDRSILTLDTYDYNSRFIERFADYILDRNDRLPGELLYGSRYKSGKSYYCKWKTGEDFDRDTIAKNPALKNPPLRNPSP